MSVITVPLGNNPTLMANINGVFLADEVIIKLAVSARLKPAFEIKRPKK